MSRHSSVSANSTVIVGAQWGDEGKGKIVDCLCEKNDLVARYQGGANAGHTVVVGDKKFKLHLLPSGVIREKRSLIGAGVVLDILALREEIAQVEKAGLKITPKVLGIDYRAPLLLPTHKILDGIQEESKAASKIGTTKQGIGPAYSDLAARTALMFSDTLAVDWEARFGRALSGHETILEKLYSRKLSAAERAVCTEYCKAAPAYAKFAADASAESSNAIAAGKPVLFEGAQGALLDNSFGTYPFVTSSHPIAGGACTGVGVSPRCISKIEGVAKAYCTRVGAGAFPSELTDKLGDSIRGRGAEFGTTTGRPRRVGWFDAVALRYSSRLNGFTGLHITKLDVLGGLDELMICDAYEANGKQTRDYPANPADFAGAKPVYKRFAGFEDLGADGWKKVAVDGEKKGLAALPQNALLFVQKISELSGVPIVSVSVGPERESIIFAKD